MNLTRRSFLIGTAASAGTAAVIAFAQQRPSAGLVQRAFVQASNRTINVREFRAMGDGRSDDRVGIQSAIDRISSAGGGTVYLPAGTYAVGRNPAGAFAVQLRNGVELRGDGESSVIKLASHASGDEGSHTLYVDQSRNVTINNLVIDGNRENQQGSGHCLKCDGIDGLLLQDLVVRNAFSYGLGFQNGYIKQVRIERVLIHDTGADGIDFKNKRNGNADIRLNDVTILRWGLRPDLRVQTGIDCRGPIAMTNIKVAEPGSDTAVGVRMRQGEIGDVNGLGGHNSSLDKFDIRMGGADAQIGINVVARQVRIRDGSIVRGACGLLVQAAAFQGSGIHVNGCSDVGLLLDDAGTEFDATGATIERCRSIGSGDDGIQVAADNVSILDCVSTGSGRHGLFIAETANGTQVVGGDFSGNRAGAILDHGNNSRLAVPVPAGA